MSKYHLDDPSHIKDVCNEVREILNKPWFSIYIKADSKEGIIFCYEPISSCLGGKKSALLTLGNDGYYTVKEIFEAEDGKIATDYFTILYHESKLETLLEKLEGQKGFTESLRIAFLKHSIRILDLEKQRLEDAGGKIY